MPSSPAEALLSVSALNVAFRGAAGDVQVVRDIDFKVRRGEIYAIIGESGSGKSTLVQAVMGLLQGQARTAGRIELDGEDIQALPARARRRLCGERMALISQDALAALNPCTTVGYQIAETLMVHRGTPKQEAWQRAVELLGLTGIPLPPSARVSIRISSPAACASAP